MTQRIGFLLLPRVGLLPLAGAVDALLAALHGHPLGKEARRIGVCVDTHVGSVVLETGFGRRLLVESDGELLPRIC